MALDPATVAAAVVRLAGQLERDSVLPSERVFTAREVGDPRFYAAHRDEIHEAIRAGRVESEGQQ